jgi:hypothetical protein
MAGNDLGCLLRLIGMLQQLQAWYAEKEKPTGARRDTRQRERPGAAV